MAHDWNIDWESVDADLADWKGILDLFAAAVWERDAMIGFEVGGFDDPPISPDPWQWTNVVSLRTAGCGAPGGISGDVFWLKTEGDLEGATALQGWHLAFEARPWHAVRMYGGAPWGYWAYTIGEAASFRPFPPEGTKRHFPREIYDLTNMGEEGNLARLTACINRSWRGVASTEAGFGTTVNTPTNLHEQSGQLFIYQSGEWVASESHVGPDRREEIVPGVANRFPFSNYLGDYFGGHWLNDTRDMLNRLTRLCVRVTRAARTFYNEITGVYYETLDGLALVNVGGVWTIQIDLAIPASRHWLIEFWINPTSGDSVFITPFESEMAYTTWTKIGQMLVSSSGRYTHPLPPGTEVSNNAQDAPGVLMWPLCAIVIRGDVEGGLQYR